MNVSSSEAQALPSVALQRLAAQRAASKLWSIVLTSVLLGLAAKKTVRAEDLFRPLAGNAGLSTSIQSLGGPTSKPAGEVSLRLGEADAGRQLQLPLASSAASSSSTSMVAIADALSLMA